MTSKLEALTQWVNQVAALTRPARIHWCDGSQTEYQSLVQQMLADGTLIELNQTTHPGCYLHRSDPRDVARVEQLTKTTGNQMTARVSHGTFATLKQVLAVPGSASVGDSAGNAGMLQNVSVNLAARTLTTDGPVSITMADGSTIEAAGLDYDATTDRWDFHGPVRLTATQPPRTWARCRPVRVK